MKNKVDDLLAILQAETEPASISYLIDAFEERVPERTLRRWLKKLVEDGLVEVTGRYKTTKYQLIRGGIENVLKHPFFSAHSVALLSQVRKSIYQRDPCSYNESWLSAYKPNQTYYLTSEQRKKIAENSKRVLQEFPAGTYAKRIFNRLLIDLSYNSSRLEGNTYSLLDTERLLFQGKSAPGKLDIEKLMILNHKEAIKFLVDGINRIKINIDNIKTIHYLLSDGLVLPSDAGQVRKEGVRISATTYMPLENHERLSRILSVICDKAQAIEDSFEQSFFLLVHTAYLQTFIDVNKRTARLVANIPLVRDNLVPLSFNDIDKEDYISAIIVIYEFNDVMPLADLFVWSYLRSCKRYDATVEAIGIDEFRVRYRKQRKELMAEIIKNNIVGDSILQFVKEKVKNTIPKKDQTKFVNEVISELNELENFKIVGMGITQAELENWKKLNK